MFLPHKVDEQPNKKPKKTTFFQREEKATTRMLWLLRKLYLRWVVPRKTRSCWILKEADKPVETRCNESRDRFTQSTERQASNREKKGPSLGKIQVKNPHQRSPYGMKFEDNSDAPEARRGTLPKTFTSSKKKTRLHSTRPRKTGSSRLRKQKMRRKESLW